MNEFITINKIPEGFAVDKPFVNLRRTLKDMEDDYGLVFREGLGQLGALKSCFVKLNEKYYLYIHKWDQVEEDYVQIDANFENESQYLEIYNMFLSAFGLSNSDIEWRRPW